MRPTNCTPSSSSSSAAAEVICSGGAGAGIHTQSSSSSSSQAAGGALRLPAAVLSVLTAAAAGWWAAAAAAAAGWAAAGWAATDGSSSSLDVQRSMASAEVDIVGRRRRNAAKRGDGGDGGGDRLQRLHGLGDGGDCWRRWRRTPWRDVQGRAVPLAPRRTGTLQSQTKRLAISLQRGDLQNPYPRRACSRVTAKHPRGPKPSRVWKRRAGRAGWALSSGEQGRVGDGPRERCSTGRSHRLLVRGLLACLLVRRVRLEAEPVH